MTTGPGKEHESAGSGYTDCACRDCFDVAVSDDMNNPDLCLLCAEAGCSRDGDCDCQRDDAYGQDEADNGGP